MKHLLNTQQRKDLKLQSQSKELKYEEIVEEAPKALVDIKPKRIHFFDLSFDSISIHSQTNNVSIEP